jgi:hypothetical protein
MEIEHPSGEVSPVGSDTRDLNADTNFEMRL